MSTFFHCLVMLRCLAFVSPHLIGVLQSKDDQTLLEMAKSMATTLGGNDTIEFVGLQLEFQDKVSYDNMRAVHAELLKSKAKVVVGPYDPTYGMVTQSLSVHYVVTDRPDTHDIHTTNVIKISPSLDTFTRSTIDLVTHFAWKYIAIFYDMPEGPMFVEALLLQQKLNVQAYDLHHPVGNSSAPRLEEILKDARQRGHNEYVVIATPRKTIELLRQALYLSMMSGLYRWLVINIHDQAFEWGEFLDTRANITDIRMLSKWKGKEECVDMRTGAMMDAVKVSALVATEPVVIARDTSCEVCNHITLSGCSGELSFDGSGSRNDNLLQLFSLNGLAGGTLGTWRGNEMLPKKRIDFTYSTFTRPDDSPFGRRVVVVTTIIEEPFVKWKNKPLVVKKDRSPVNVNDLEGFLIDILRELAKMLRFEFVIYLCPDGKFGSKKPYGWTGMVRELMENRADIALAPFSITPKRASVVDFTVPYMIKGTTIIIKSPTRHVATFQFLAPFSTHVWIGILVSFLVSSCVLFGMARINSDKHIDILINMKEMFWYIWGTLLNGSLEYIPKAASSRVLIATWWFFSLILISVYTANLAAFLTITSVNVPMKSAADLSSQSEYQYGTVEGSQIEAFFQNTKLDRYAKMAAHMKLDPSSMVRRVENGLQRVKEEKYAFLWDSPTLRHKTQGDCDLMEIGSPFDLKGYGLATVKDATYLDDLSWAILKMSDEDKTRQMEKEWWGKSGCQVTTDAASSDSIGLTNALGIFLVLGFGILASVIYCLVRNSKRIFKYLTAAKRKSTESGERVEMSIAAALGNHYEPIFKFRAADFGHSLVPAGDDPTARLEPQ